MTAQTAVIVCIAVVILAVAALVLFLNRERGRDEGRIVIQNGVDVDTRRRGTDKGIVFKGAPGIQGTYLIGTTANPVCRVRLSDIQSGEQYQLSFRNVCGIGRSENARGIESFLTIRGDQRISSFHCMIWKKNEKLFIEDAGSKNHTEVNGKRIKGQKQLRCGDVVRIGNTRLKVSF